MKQLFPLFIFSIIFATFTVNKNTSSQLIQMVVTVPNMNSQEIQKNLEIEFNNLNGVEICETSLMTRTLMVKYNPRSLDQEDFDNVFQKWGCTPVGYAYQKLY